MNENPVVHKILSVLLVFIAVIVIHPVQSTALDEQRGSRKYVSQGDYFTCTVPAGWSEYHPTFGLSQEEKKVYGATLFGPSDGSRVSPVISIHYYAPGNLLHKTMDKFVRTHSQTVSSGSPDSHPYGEVRPTPIAGRQAKTFERTNIRYIGERSLNPDKVVLYECFAVIPDGKDQGFYVLKLSVSVETKSKYAGIFEAFVKSFQPAE